MNNDNSLDPSFPLGYTLAKLTKPYYGAFTKYMEQFYDLDKHFYILLMIDEAEGQPTQQCICNKLKLDKVTMVRILDHLDEKGYIKRIMNPEDRRERWIQLTPKAQAEMPLIRQSIQEMNDRAFAGFDNEERAKMYSMMERVLQNVSSLPSNPVTLKYGKKLKR